MEHSSSQAMCQAEWHGMVLIDVGASVPLVRWPATT